ncbi:MAG: VanZ family protein [Tannerella sp.]|jgi:VanZ family protein|nr:VanZ family protein [Tannerella sp.]
MGNGERAYILLLMSVVWAIVIFVFSTMPSDNIPQMKIPNLDKIFHFGVFFVQSILLSLLFNFRIKNSYFRIIMLSTLLAFIYGGFIEIMQSKFFNRTGDLLDLIVDIAGGFIGAMIYPAVLKLYGSVSGKRK